MTKRLDRISFCILQDIEGFLEKLDNELNLEGFIKSNRLTGICPIHEGADNHTAFNIFLSKDEDMLLWKCHSHGCNEKYGSNIDGFISGCFKIGRPEALNWLENFLGIQQKKQDFFNYNNELTQINKLFRLDSKKKMSFKVFDKKCLSKLNEPCEHFLKRGFSPEILQKYNVGFVKKSKYFENRCVVPVFHHETNDLIGFTGRTILPNKPKWKHHEISTSQTLYNMYNARPYIESKKKIILVEGLPNVWKLEMSGIQNSVAIFGSSISREQIDIIKKLDIKDIVCCFDNDEAGRRCFHKIQNHSVLRYLFNIQRVEIPNGFNDVAEMEVEDIKVLFNF